MLNAFLQSIVREDEVVRQIVRANPVRYFFQILFSFLFTVGPFFFLYPLLQQREWGLLIFLISFIVGLFLSFRTWFLWYRNVFIVTDQRLIDVDQKSLFHRMVSEVLYDKIQDVSFSVKGILPTLFRFGTLLIQTAGKSNTIEFDGVYRPEKLQSVIVRLQSEYMKRTGGQTRDAQSDAAFDQGRQKLQELLRLWGKKKLQAIVNELTENDK